MSLKELKVWEIEINIMNIVPSKNINTIYNKKCVI